MNNLEMYTPLLNGESSDIHNVVTQAQVPQNVDNSHDTFTLVDTGLWVVGAFAVGKIIRKVINNPKPTPENDLATIDYAVRKSRR